MILLVLLLLHDVVNPVAIAATSITNVAVSVIIDADANYACH